MNGISGTGLRASLATQAEIHASREQWNVLVQGMRHPTPFLSWEWIAGWMESAPDGYRLKVIFVRDGAGALVAILPLAMKRARLKELPFKVWVLTFCSALELYPDHLDLICEARADGRRILEHCFAFLLGGNGVNADVVYLPYLATEGHLASLLREGAIPGLTIKPIGALESPYVDLSEGYPAYLGNMSKKKRYNLNRERSILCEEHGARFLAVEPDAQSLQELFDLHARRAQDKGLETTFSGERVLDFHKTLAASLAGTGRVRLYRLSAGEQVIATAYGFVLANEFSFYQTGFDPAWKKLSPGKAMIAMVLEELAREGVKLFDFLGGSDEYKKFWATGSRQMQSFLGFSTSASGLFSRSMYSLRAAAANVLRRVRALAGSGGLFRN